MIVWTITSHAVAPQDTNGVSTVFFTRLVLVLVTSFPFTLTLTLYFCVTVTSSGFVIFKVSLVVPFARTTDVCPVGVVAPARFAATAESETTIKNARSFRITSDPPFSSV